MKENIRKYPKRDDRFPKELHYNEDICAFIADICVQDVENYKELLAKYPYSNAMRDVSTCMRHCAPDIKGLKQLVKEGKLTWINTGWLIFIGSFVLAAEKEGLTAREYADYVYKLTEDLNDEMGFRAAWIEAYGEIGNSISWPKDKKFTKKEALEYFREYFSDGRSLTRHWGSVSPVETISFYSHAKSISEDLRKLSIDYIEGSVLVIHEAFRMGFAMVMFESQCGTYNPTQLGISFVRGGAKMYDAFWGCDFSPWNSAMMGAVIKTNNVGYRLEGMSADHMFRAWLTAYMSGSNTIYYETGYSFFYANINDELTTLTDYGYKAMQLYALANGVLRDRGTPKVPFAVMLEEEHGYRGECARIFDEDGNFSTDNSETPDSRLYIWHNRVQSITRGDWQVNRTFGTIWETPKNKFFKEIGNWPDKCNTLDLPVKKEYLKEFNQSYKEATEYDRYLANSKWADCFDAIIENAKTDMLKKYYKAILLTGDIKTDNGLLDRLIDFMETGGTVIATMEQLDESAKAYLNLDIAPCLEIINVEAVSYENETIKINERLPIHVINSSKSGFNIVASDALTDTPLIIKANIGQGGMYIVMISNGMDEKATKMSDVYTSLIDKMYNKLVGIKYEGPMCGMIINSRKDDTLVTLTNHMNEAWEGNIVYQSKDGEKIIEIKDVLIGQTVPAQYIKNKNGIITVKVRISPCAVKVLSFSTVQTEDIGCEFDLTQYRMNEEDQKRFDEIRSKGPYEILGKA